MQYTFAESRGATGCAGANQDAPTSNALAQPVAPDSFAEV